MTRDELLMQLVLVVATASVSGLAIPLELRKVDEQRTKELKNREAIIARQTQLINEQIDFLDKLAEVFWAWRYLVVQVTYCAARSDPDTYEETFKDYQKSIWKHLNSFRCLTSKSRRILPSTSTYKRLLSFYFYMVNLDKEIYAAEKLEVGGQRELRFRSLNHRIINEVSEIIDETLFCIGKDLKLYPEAEIDEANKSESKNGRISYTSGTLDRKSRR